MKNFPVLFLFLLLFTWASCQNRLEYSIVIHGGAGNITPDRISAEAASNIEAKLSEALDRGTMILEKGGSSLDAVVEVIKILEDSPLFNAGKGAVFNHEGKNELDASIMEGLNLMAGAVTGVGDIKNPIIAARLVMDKSPHVLMMGAGASGFAASHGAEIVDSGYFHTQRRCCDTKSYK